MQSFGEFMVEKGSPFELSIKRGDVKTLSKLLADGKELSSSDIESMIRSYNMDFLPIIKKLITDGTIKATETYNTGRDIVHFAVLYQANSDELKFIKDIINIDGVNLNIIDDNGNTPLSNVRTVDAMKALLDAGADYKIKINGEILLNVYKRKSSALEKAYSLWRKK